MALPNAPNPIALSAIANVFGGSAPHSMSEYYDGNAGIVATGMLQFKQFHGKSAMTPAVVLGSFGIGPWGSASQFADPSAEWIWTDAGAATSAPHGIPIYFNARCTVSVATPVVVHIIIDNSGTLYHNGTTIGSCSGGWTAPDYPKFNITLTPGVNVLGFTGFNAGSSPNPAGLLLSVIRVSDNAVLLRTNSAWRFRV